ncbi:hypothetical protein D7X48_06020 [bacterium D16-50]|jgi:putative aldouronate transport system substrate-binding protein|nr:hypothetical protein [Lachnospiraceae bacterium]RKJ21074.1 hypothetical protein D7X48_06020 [bacterium D16-50]
MKKRLLAMLLTLTMTMSFLAGCGGEDAGESGKGTEDKSNVSGTSGDGGAGLGDYEKVSGFSVYCANGGIDNEAFNNQPLAKKIREVTGYDVKFIQLSTGTDADAAVNNIFNLKEDVQGVFVTKSQFNDLVASGALAPLTEYVNASENLKSVISDIGWGSATGEDGEIYAIPNSDPRECTSVGFYYRLDWLNEYNAANPDKQIPIPAEENGYSMSLSNFRKMLEYFDGKVTGGNAFVIDTDPHTSNYDEFKPVYMQTILPAFGIYSEWADVKGTLTYIVDQDGFKEYMEYMEGLFDDGLITYQATQNDTNAVNSLMNDMAGVALVNHTNPYSLETSRYPELSDEEKQTFVDTTYAGYIAALVPDDRDGDAAAVRVWSKKAYNFYFVCPAWNSDAQTASVVDYCDKKLDKDVFLGLTIGVEGESFEIKDGGYYPILPAFNDTYNLADKFLTGTREADYAEYWLARTRKTAAQGRMFGLINYNIENTGIKDPICMLPSNEVVDSSYANARNAVVEELIKTVFNADAKFDYDSIKGIWESKKGKDIEKAVNDWYSTWEYRDSFNSVKPR